MYITRIHITNIKENFTIIACCVFFLDIYFWFQIDSVNKSYVEEVLKVFFILFLKVTVPFLYLQVYETLQTHEMQMQVLFFHCITQTCQAIPVFHQDLILP